MLLYWLTLAVAAAVVLVLAGYLIAVATALVKARNNVSRLADGLERVARHTAPLEEKTAAVGGALEDIAAGFEQVDRDLGSAAEAFGE